MPVTASGFEFIREENLLYVDKTKQILQLLEEGEYLFFSRPRRFGKSLLINTLKALFEGKKYLFEGLYIYDRWDWVEYPVIHLDFSNISYSSSIDIFKFSMKRLLQGIGRKYGIVLEDAPDYLIIFIDLIEQLHQKFGKKVVVLIDEYDKPINDILDNLDKLAENQNVLKEFYTFLKAQHQYLKFVFITGVSKYAKVSVFSGMNNMKDVSLLPAMNDLVGLTKQEIEENFSTHIDNLISKNQMTQADLFKKIKFWYNGYSWDAINYVYNPFSIVRFFDIRAFENFWFESGTPTMLVKLIIQKAKQEKLSLQPTDYEGIKVHASQFDAADANHIDIPGLLFQTGYLTITDIEATEIGSLYTLNYPNFEVRSSFSAHILQEYAQIPKGKVETEAIRMRLALQKDEPTEFLKLLRAYFALIPYQLRKNADEAYYHSLFQMMFNMLGIEMVSERSTDTGRIDGVVELSDKIFIIEFKYKRTGTLPTLIKNALQQIKDKNYATLFENSDKPIILAGIGFLEKNEDEEGKMKLEIDGEWERYGLN